MTIYAEVWFWVLSVILPTLVLALLLVWQIVLLRRIERYVEPKATLQEMDEEGNIIRTELP